MLLLPSDALDDPNLLSLWAQDGDKSTELDEFLQFEKQQ